MPPVFESVRQEEYLHPFGKLAEAFHLADDDELKPATPQELVEIERAAISCKWITKWSLMPIMAVAKYSPHIGFRRKMIDLLKSDSEIIRKFGPFIRYALVRLRLWGVNESPLEPARGWHGNIEPEDIENWLEVFDLKELQEVKATFPPGSRSDAFMNDIYDRDGSTCLITGECSYKTHHAAHLPAYSWRPKKKELPNTDLQIHSCRVIAMFLSAFLGRKIYGKLYKMLSKETAESGMTMDLVSHIRFGMARFYLDPLLETIERDKDTGETITYAACIRSFSQDFWYSVQNTVHAYSDESTVEADVRKRIYDTFYGKAYEDLALRGEVKPIQLAPNLKLRIFRISHHHREVPLPNPALMVLHGCITMLLILGGVVTSDDPRYREVTASKRKEHPGSSVASSPIQPEAGPSSSPADVGTPRGRKRPGSALSPSPSAKRMRQLDEHDSEGEELDAGFVSDSSDSTAIYETSPSTRKYEADPQVSQSTCEYSETEDDDDDFDDDFNDEIRRRVAETEWDTEAMAAEIRRLCFYGADL